MIAVAADIVVALIVLAHSGLRSGHHNGPLGHFQIPFQVVVLGAITGMLYGILAVGLVLVYRSNRIINFAHGEIGAFAAALLGLSVVRWHVPYWVAFPLALAFAALVGSLSEIVVIRRLRKAPAVMSIVATLGLAAFLVVFSLVLNNQAGSGHQFPQPPFFPHFNIRALRVTPSYSAMLFVTPVLVIGLVWFLRKSRAGLAIRASAANADAARLAGVFSARMSTMAWAIAGAVSAFTAILVLPTQGFTSAQFLGPTLLLRALTAAVIADMTSLPIALVSGIGVGIIEQVLLWNYPQGGLVDAVLFLIIVAVLLLRRRRTSVREEAKGNWAAVQAWPPVPERLQQVWAIRNLGMLVAAVSLVAALLVPILSTNATSVVFVTILAFSIVGLSLGIITGLGGQLSLGQFALAGVGALASYVVDQHTSNLLLGFLAGACLAAVVSLVIGIPALRIRGLLLTVTTLGFALAAQNWLFQQSWMFGNGVDSGQASVVGITLNTGKRYYLFALVPVAVAFGLARNVWRSGIGRRLRAIRDNENAAKAFTIPVSVAKVQAFMVAGFLAGLGGALYGHALSHVSGTAFPIDSSIDVAAMTILGGAGVLAGPLIGALYIIGIPQFLPLDNAGLAATSLGWLLLILYFPGGIAQMIQPLRARVIALIARLSGVDPDDVAAPPVLASVQLAAAPTTNGHRGALARTIPAAAHGPGPVLRVNHLGKSFGGVRAVDDVTFDVAHGDIIGLIGPNGAGKTTLFELISGFTKPDIGQVHFLGRDVSGLGPEARGRLGLIRSFQDAALFPTMTVLETVMLSLERAHPTQVGAAMIGLRRRDRQKEARARELVALMGLDPFRTSQIAALSTGTRRITELTCVLGLEPTLLLLDEPSSGIAQRETEALGQLLTTLRDALEITMIVVEHDIPLIMGLADRVIAMESGNVIADGRPEAIRNDPKVVESYLGLDIHAIERSTAPIPVAPGPAVAAR